ncbi:copper resistance CopC family protein [Lentzea sp. NEAU-D7]|uniref:copper resistance CopC family protein n=1 Tax=Lentzea sp. NEAU-D7 TaxID=2994667 RepID=UPI00224B1FA9|nr:copper resistance CopC family protein [Lentzea sp. NEAU-D7]MCX2954517.1 copper resistance protein CopC [Lentzea sp. NEAU-D7]
MTAALLLALTTAAMPALAHTELKGSNPAKGAALPAPPTQVGLTFTEAVTLPVDAITVSGHGDAKWAVGQPASAGTLISAPVQATGAAGAHTITWKVVADDGDTVSGTIDFTLTAPVTTTTTTTTSFAPAAQPQQDEGGDEPTWVWILIGVVVLAGIGVAVRRHRARPRRR